MIRSIPKVRCCRLALGSKYVYHYGLSGAENNPVKGLANIWNDFEQDICLWLQTKGWGMEGIVYSLSISGAVLLHLTWC